MSRTNPIDLGWALPALAVALAACGGARPSAATTTTTTTTTSSTEAETTTVSSAPCSAWDPAGEPTTAPIDVRSPPEGARRSLSGLRWCVLRAGDGNARPGPTARVTVHYTGWTTNGNMFDSSRARGEPIDLPLDGVIAGWTEGLQLMTVGEVRRFWIPESLAYGGRPGAPAGMLVFDVELLAILP